MNEANEAKETNNDDRNSEEETTETEDKLKLDDEEEEDKSSNSELSFFEMHKNYTRTITEHLSNSSDSEDSANLTCTMDYFIRGFTRWSNCIHSKKGVVVSKYLETKNVVDSKGIFWESFICHPKEDDKYSFFFVQREAYEINLVFYNQKLLMTGYMMANLEIAKNEGWVSRTLWLELINRKLFPTTWTEEELVVGYSSSQEVPLCEFLIAMQQKVEKIRSRSLRNCCFCKCEPCFFRKKGEATTE